MREKRIARQIYRCSANRRHQAGLTLIELLISVAIIAVVAALIYGVLFQGLTNFTVESEKVEAQSNVRYGLTYLSRAIRKGQSVSVVDNYESYGAALLIDGTHYYYYDHQLYEKKEEEAPVPLVAGIGGMSVSMVDKRITLTVVSRPDSRGNTVSETMDIYLRE